MPACTVRMLGALDAFETNRMEYAVAIESERDWNYVPLEAK